MGTPRPPYFAIALISSAALSYEILLTRLFTIVHWSHFAAVAISLALLGFGASGTLVALFRRQFEAAFPLTFISACWLFSLLAPAAFLAAQALPFNPLELAWDWRQLGWLSLQFILLSLPFLAAGTAIGMALSFFTRNIPRTYAFDLIGAGIGALFVVLSLELLSTGTALTLTAMMGILAAVVAATELKMSKSCHWITVPLALALVLSSSWLEPEPSPYKDLSHAMQVIGAEQEKRHSSVEGEYVVLQNSQVPIRHAPGISLSLSMSIPEQRSLFHNGDALGAITRFNGDLEELAFTNSLVSALPYTLLENPSVLVLEAGGGLPVLQALFNHAQQIEVVDPMRGRVQLLGKEMAEFSGDLYHRPDVQLHRAHPRLLLQTLEKNIDLIQLDQTVGQNLALPGLSAREANWLLTTEGLSAALNQLQPEGLLSIAHWLQLPPRHSLRLFNTALAALESHISVTNPASHIAYVRCWKTGVLLVSRTPLEAVKLDQIRSFSEARSFDLVFPARDCNQTNRFNQLNKPMFCEAMKKLAGNNAAQFSDDYLFDVEALTDDRPYAGNHTRLKHLIKLLSLEARAGFSQLDWGHMLLLITLIQAIPLSIFLIVLPLFFVPKKHVVSKGIRWPVVIYFAAIGLGFMAYEITYLEQLQYFLGEPVYAISVSLAGFLIFAALGSSVTTRLVKKLGHSLPILILFALALTTVSQLWMGNTLFAAAANNPFLIKFLVALLWIAPIAFLLGMPLPMGLQWLAAGAQNQVPWAWAINGCASVAGAVLAALLAMEIGFTNTLIFALILYGLALVTVLLKRQPLTT